MDSHCDDCAHGEVLYDQRRDNFPLKVFPAQRMKRTIATYPQLLRGFSLVSFDLHGILSMLMVLLMMTTMQTQSVWTRTRSRVEEFREARTAFEAVTRRVSQATLNSVWDYDNAQAPTKYNRQSDLHFVCGPAVSTNGNPRASADTAETSADTLYSFKAHLASQVLQQEKAMSPYRLIT